MLVAGLMSGTSADAIDVAIVEIRGRGWNARMELKGFHSVRHSPPVRRRILAVAGGAPVSAREISQLNFLLGEMFARACLAACRRLGIPITAIQLIGSHGQTIHHQPEAARECGLPVRSTLQIGEPAIIAARTGATTIADFRTADLAAGGQGAPLVPYFDYLTFRHPKRGRIALNIGGIANLTAIPAGAPPGKVIAFDTGPGNMLIDALASRITGGRQSFDRGGKLAAQGTINEPLIERLLGQEYFNQRAPKSTGRELFGEKFAARWFPIKPGDAAQKKLNTLATATAFTAASISDAVRRFVLPLGTMRDCFVSGGGVRNAFLMEQLGERLQQIAGRAKPLGLISTENAHIPSRAKEAAAFALLAYQTFHGEPSNLPSATGAARPVILGKTVFSSRRRSPANPLQVMPL